MDILAGYGSYAVFLVILAGIYTVMALGLNIQWGLTGQFNIGIAGFFALGAYISAIATTPDSPSHLGGFGLPFVAGLLAAMVASGILAVLVGLITLNLRTDYLAIATIGIAEIVRLALKNEEWLTNGVRGIVDIPRPLSATFGDSPIVYMAIVLIVMLCVYVALERGLKSPWGRVLRAIRESEPGTMAAGKNVLRFRMEAFVIGSMIMGLSGALYAHFVGFISPEAFHPEFVTFIVWVMLIAGGSGNNRGAILGGFGIWILWSGTELLTWLLPPEFVTRAGALRILLIGILVQVILVWRPQGLLPERAPDTGYRGRRAADSD